MKDDLPNDSEIPFIFAVCFKVLVKVFMLLSRNRQPGGTLIMYSGKTVAMEIPFKLWRSSAG